MTVPPNIDWAATGTMALAVIAFASFWLQLCYSAKQLRDARNDIAIRIHLKFVDRWDRASMHKKRMALAFQFLEQRRGITQVRDKDIKEDVMDFFEDLGILSRKGRLDDELTYEVFSYYAKGWWFFCKPYVVRLRDRKGDLSLFADFEAFTIWMMEREAKEPGINRAGIEPTEHDLADFDFLNEEYLELSV